MRRIAILGAGGMGTALAVLLARSGRAEPVALWCRDPSRASAMAADRVNARHLPGIELPVAIRPTADPAEAADDADLLIVAVPSAFVRATLAAIAPAIPPGVPALSVIKGIERATFARPSRAIVEAIGPRDLAILSGPGHAEEIARGLPASLVVASNRPALGLAVRDLLTTSRFRVYTNADAIGVELAGALKNILGLAGGICEGLGFGDNAKAALLTRGLAEMTRFAVGQGARAETFLGLAGVGDLVTTCYSPFGRNRAVGIRLGRGEPIASIVASMADVAEGVVTTRSVAEQARRLGVAMPITAEVEQILDGKPALLAVSDLMDRLPKDEWP